MAYDIYPAVDEGYNFPPQVRQSIAASTEIKAAIQNESADIVPPLVADALASDDTIENAVILAAETTIKEINVVRAFPENPTNRSGKSEIPMFWVNRTMNDPVGNTVGDTLDATFSGDTLYWQNVPLLTNEGVIWQKHLPDNVVLRENIKQYLSDMISNASLVQSLSTRLETNISSDLPVLGARLAAAKKRQEPIAGVYTGSSTSRANPGYIKKLSQKIQNTYVVSTDSSAQWSTSSNFIERIDVGFHLYSSAEGGTRSDNYLTYEECERIAELNPAFILHMVGSNDYSHKRTIAAYKSGLREKLDWFDDLLTMPCQHIFIQAYERMDVTSPAALWEDYGLAAKEIFEARPDGVYYDIAPLYISNGVPGADPLTLISSDKVHQTDVGYEFMADILTNIFVD